ncbi:hypothetical protein [Bacteroides sp.]|uniref:hypothetical protein n=1 Tax=Bacteroides sp. TaxID=29523 RepID=UPI00260BA261|nr:hypothetical protein [Bacteroides sp.]MDD3038962.1 hypothetical protein [Bacteroides sp.]
MKHICKYIVFIYCFLSLYSCEIKTTDPNQSYKFWTGDEVKPDSFQVLKGQYWKSAHFTNEYIAYFKIKSIKNWDDYLKKKLFQVDSIVNDSIKQILSKPVIPSDAPEWFKLEDDFVQYTIDTIPDVFNQNLYFLDKKENIWYIYEIQL